MNIPAEIITAASTGFAGLLTLVGIHFSKIPIKLVFGRPATNGHTPITSEMLRENCDLRQETLDRKLERMFAGITTATGKIDRLAETVTAYRIELGERLARVEEAKK